MQLRIASLLAVTGLAFMLMGWIDPAGPLLVVLGALMGALEVERRLDAQPIEQAGAPRPVVDGHGQRHAA